MTQSKLLRTCRVDALGEEIAFLGVELPISFRLVTQAWTQQGLLYYQRSRVVDDPGGDVSTHGVAAHRAIVFLAAGIEAPIDPRELIRECCHDDDLNFGVAGAPVPSSIVTLIVDSQNCHLALCDTRTFHAFLH